MLRIVSIAAVADIQYADADPRGGREPRECVDRLQNAILHRNNRDLDWGVVLGDIIDWDDIDHTPLQTPPATAEAHRDQTQQCGAPYILHPLDLVQSLTDGKP